MKIQLGQKCRDIISGFVGVAVCRTEWINGCDRVTLQPSIDKDGKLPDQHTFDEPNLRVIEDTPIANHDTGLGGPRPEPQRAIDPKR